MLFNEITDILEEVTQRVVIECFIDTEVFRLEDLDEEISDTSEMVRIVADALSPTYLKKLSKYFSSFGANLLIISLANEFLSETNCVVDYDDYYCEECEDVVSAEE